VLIQSQLADERPSAMNSHVKGDVVSRRRVCVYASLTRSHLVSLHYSF